MGVGDQDLDRDRKDRTGRPGEVERAAQFGGPNTTSLTCIISNDENQASLFCLLDIWTISIPYGWLDATLNLSEAYFTTHYQLHSCHSLTDYTIILRYSFVSDSVA